MENFRSDKKLRRKQAWKRYEKTRNILNAWAKGARNSKWSGKRPSVQFPKSKKWPSRVEPISGGVNPIRMPQSSQGPKNVIKLKWYQRLWKIIQKLLKLKRK